MKDISRILVATDFSTHADAARDAAIELAAKTGATMELAYAYHLPTVTTPDVAAIPTSVWDDVRRGATARLDEQAQAARDRGVECEIKALEGPPGLVLAEHARRTKADLVVMGTRGLGGLKRAVLGSVAAKTVRTAPCPVLTVKEGSTFSGKTIIVPMDFSLHAEAALALARRIASAYGGHIILVHGHEVPVELREFLHAQGMDTARSLSEAAKQSLDRQFRELQDAGISSEFVVDESSPEELVLQLAEHKVADLIIMGTHGRTGLAHLLLGSVAERVVRDAACPVITTRDFEAD